MTSSPFDPPRRFSIMPSRAPSDQRLGITELRVLGALCIYTNSAGVCWPTMETLANASGYAVRLSVNNAIKKLKALGYVRQLRSKDYAASGWRINRYQVLWTGDEPMPRLEDIHLPMPRAEMIDDDSERRTNGIAKGAGDAEHSLALSLAHAYARGVQEATGQTVVIANVIRSAHQHAADGVTPETMRQAAYAACKAALAARRGVPGITEVSCS